VLWALGRAGRAAVARGLLDPTPIAAREAMGLGLAHGVVSPGESAGPGGGASMTALTTARDLMRARCGSRSSAALELAAFRLLFAAGDPIEGAGAFLERRDPVFPAADPTRSRWEDST
jgi:enoyl-CoA hydratase/carnithine racemase